MNVCNECKALGGSHHVIPHIHTCSHSSEYMDDLEKRYPGFTRPPSMQLRDFGRSILKCLKLPQLVPELEMPELIPAELPV